MYINTHTHTHHTFFACSSIDGHFRLSPFLGNSSDAVYSGVHVSFQMTVLSGFMPRSGIAGSCGNSICSFLGASILLHVVATPICVPTTSVRVYLWPPCSVSDLCASVFLPEPCCVCLSFHWGTVALQRSYCIVQ